MGVARLVSIKDLPELPPTNTSSVIAIGDIKGQFLAKRFDDNKSRRVL